MRCSGRCRCGPRCNRNRLSDRTERELPCLGCSHSWSLCNGSWTGPNAALFGYHSGFADMAKLGDVGSVYLTPVLKTIAAAYITSFGALSREAGEEAVASAIELVGKAVILLMAVPLVQAIFVSLLGLLDF